MQDKCHLGVTAAVVALLSSLLISGCGSSSSSSNSSGSSTASTTTLTVSNSKPTTGSNVTLTATVSSTAAAGTVTFYQGSTSLGNATLSSGVATLSTSFSAAGTYSLTASYGGSSTYAASTSSAVSITVTEPLTSTTTTLSASTAGPTAGESVTLTASVTPSATTGTVTFYQGTTALGTGTLSSGVATLSASFSTAGTYSLTAVYGGSTSYGTSTSAALLITVSSSSTTSTSTTLSDSSGTPATGAAVTFTATVAPSDATGSVKFFVDSALASTKPLSSGTATYSMSWSSAGTHTIYAVYEGDSTNSSSTSNTLSIAVAFSSSNATINLIVSPTSVSYGSGVALAAIVTPVGSSGEVTFYDESTSSTLGTATLSEQSVAALTTTSLSIGSHVIHASYSSLQSSSAAVTITSATSGSFINKTSCGYTSDGATGAYVLNSGTLITSDQTYSTSTSNQNAICVTGTKSYLTLVDPMINSSAITTSDGDSSWYGLDAAVLDYNGGNLTIDGGTIMTTGAGGNMVYSYGTGTVTISNATLSSTSSGNGHGIYAAGAGTIVANNVTAPSTGGSSSIVATDNGGGTVTINGGSYTAQGGKSAGIYSTGAITANNATFASTEAEAAVIEGDNSITLNNTTLISSSTGTHRGIFLYQSMSGDANNTSSTCESIATGDCIVMNGGSFTYKDTTSGNSDPASNCTAFEVYNQTALIILTDVEVNNNCGTLLLSGYNDQWSNSSAYGYATFKAYGTTSTGNIIVGDTCLSSSCTTRDTSSTAAIYLYKGNSGIGSSLTGAINNADTGKIVNLTMDSASRWVVTGTSYLTSLTDADSTYSNITCQTSGCKVYVNGNAIGVN